MRILVLGAGRMGAAMVHDLLRSAGVEGVGVADNDRGALERLAHRYGRRRLTTHRLNATHEEAVRRLLDQYDSAASALPYRHNLRLARAAIQAGVHFCDLGGSHEIRSAQQRLHNRARRSGVALLPDCGLAPGLSSVLVAHGAPAFKRLEQIEIYVGGLPQHPKPPLDYALYFSPEGLINEYAEPVEIITRGRRQRVAPLTGLETLRFQGLPPLEAFYTSGGSSTLPRTFSQVRELHEKTIRYQEHCERIRALQALGFFSPEPVLLDGIRVSPRQMLIHQLRHCLPSNEPDIVLVRVVLTGRTKKGPGRLLYELRDEFDRRNGLTAMMRTTAFPTSIAVQLLAQGAVPPGVHTLETAMPAGLMLGELKKRGVLVRRRWA